MRRHASGAVLLFAFRAQAYDPDDVTGDWESPSGTVIRIAPAGDGTFVGRVVEPSPAAAGLTYKPGDKVLTLMTPSANAWTYRLHVWPRTAEFRALGKLYELSVQAQLELDGTVLRGWYQDVKLAPIRNNAGKLLDFKVMTGTARRRYTLTRRARTDGPLELSDLRLNGFHDAEPAVSVVDPVLPRFYITERGWLAVDLDPGELKDKYALDIEILDAKDGGRKHKFSLGHAPRRLPFARHSSRRWQVLYLAVPPSRDFFDKDEYYTGVGLGMLRTLYKLGTTRFRLTFRGGSDTRVYESPTADRYQVLKWVRQRATYLAQILLGSTLRAARVYYPNLIEPIGWTRFVRKDRRTLTFVAANRSGRPATLEMVRIYALSTLAGRPHELVHSEKVTLGPGDSRGFEHDLRIDRWRDDRLKALRGFHVVAGKRAAERIAAGRLGPASIRTMVSLKRRPDEARAAAILRRRLPRFERARIDGGGTSKRVVPVANRFVAGRPSDTNVVAAFNAAKLWHSQIVELARPAEDGATSVCQGTDGSPAPAHVEPGDQGDDHTHRSTHGAQKVRRCTALARVRAASPSTASSRSRSRTPRSSCAALSPP